MNKIVGHIHIEPTIIVKITNGGTQAPFFVDYFGLKRNIREGVPIVSEQMVRGLFKIFPFRSIFYGIALAKIVTVIDQIHIQVPVFVVIKKIGLHGEAILVQSPLLCFIFKSSIFLIDEKLVFSKFIISEGCRFAYVDVQPTIVVYVHHGYSRGPAIAILQTSFFRYIHKLKITLI